MESSSAVLFSLTVFDKARCTVSYCSHTNMGIRTALFTLNRPLEEGLARLARGHSVVETCEEERGRRLQGHSSF